jgi:hypothetical protein
MNHSESILGTLKYLDDLSKRSSDKELHEEKLPASNVFSENNIEQNTKLSYATEKKLKAPKKDPIAAAEPHLKKFAGMLSEELANIKKLQQEEQERIKKEEAERVRLEEAERVRLEIVREKIRLEEEKARQAQEENIRIEEELKSVKIQEEQQKSLTENKIEEPVQQIKEYVDKKYRKTEVNPSILAFSENKKQQRNLKEQTDFVTFEDLKKHYVDFLGKLNTQLASLGGGGEVLMRRLDDVDMSTIEDGYFISFDAASNKFVGQEAAPGLESIIEGGSF